MARLRGRKKGVKGTRITVDEVLGALAAGMTYDEIEKEYGVTKEGVKAAQGLYRR